MAAILRSGKFLRIFSGLARNLAATNKGTDDNNLVPQIGISFDKNFASQAFSIHNVLPYIGVSDSGHAEDRYPTRVSSRSKSLGTVSRQELDVMIAEIKGSEAEENSPGMFLLASQALLAIRLCGAVLAEEVPESRSKLVSSIWNLLAEKNVTVNINHYNALLRVHLENKHDFNPEDVLLDMKSRGLEPSRETYQCFISRYCQEGNIDGASSTLQTMKQKGFGVNENIFNSLIMGHSEAGDMPRAHGMIKVMKQWSMTPSAESYLTLCCGYGRHGDHAGMEKTIGEASNNGVALADGDYLEMVFVLSEAGHKEHVGKILARTRPEAEDFPAMAAHLVVRLVNAGHDDVAYNVVEVMAANSTEEGKGVVSQAFLGQMVKLSRPVAKLLWFANDMAEKGIHKGGLDTLVNLAIGHGDVELGVKLTEMLLAEGGRIGEKQFNKMVALSRKQPGEDCSNLMACVKLGATCGYITPDMLKKSVFPKQSTWPELMIAQLEEAGLDRSVTVTPLLEWLIGQGRSAAAATVAGIFPEHVDSKLHFLTPNTRPAPALPPPQQQEPVEPVASEAAASAVAVSGDLDSAITDTDRCQSVTSGIAAAAGQFLAQDRLADMELLLEVTAAAGEDDRRAVYLALLQGYSRHGMIDRAVQLSRALNEERLVIPEFQETLGQLIESKFDQNRGAAEESVPVVACDPTPQQQYSVQAFYDPVGQTYVPVVTPVMVTQPYMDHAQYYNPYYHYQPPVQYVGPTPCPTPDTCSASVTSDYDSSYRRPSETPTDLSVVSTSTETAGTRDQSALHRQLKKAIGSGNIKDGLEAYQQLEQIGKVVNVTETSALTEQLIRADMTQEATELTMSMLKRNTHPLPKIFRFLLNKLALNGCVEEMGLIGEYLTTKVKKDVSFDNRLCNAYLSAGRGEEFLDRMVCDLDIAIQAGDRDKLEAVQDRFPRGGAMGLLDNHPDLVGRFSQLATKFAEVGYIAPMNVLWTYHFIHQDTEKAGRIWQDYVKDSNQIMFQKVCQVARATGNLELSFGLVNQLSDADNVSSGAKGIAYSCLLDCLCLAGQHRQGWTVLQQALARGVALQDVNRTALVRLKTGLEETGETFPYEIPPKNTSRDLERTNSPALDWNEF